MPIPKRKQDFSVSIGPIRLSMWKLKTGNGPIPKSTYAYRFFDGEWSPDPVFEGDDFSAPADMEWNRAAAELLSFLTLAEGDTEDEFFENYSPEQLKWRDARAKDLQLDAMAFEEEIELEAERRWRRERRGVVPKPKRWEPGRP